jgi:hypothetical protein
MQFETADGLGEDADRLLAAIPASLQARVRAVLANPRLGGRGLRAWLALLETEDRPLPDALPAELVEVYLMDTEAEPLHDCESCGLPVPVRAGWRAGHEPSADRVYFPACPHCGGRTGPYAFWARASRAAAC